MLRLAKTQDKTRHMFTVARLFIYPSLSLNVVWIHLGLGVAMVYEEGWGGREEMYLSFRTSLLVGINVIAVLVGHICPLSQHNDYHTPFVPHLFHISHLTFVAIVSKTSISLAAPQLVRA